MATKTISGKVEATSRKANKDGYFALKIAGGDEWYNTRENANPYWNKEVTFEAGSRKGKWYVVDDDVTVSGDGGGTTSSDGGEESSSYGGKKSRNNATPRRDAGPDIIYQHAQKVAVELVKTLLEHDAVALGPKANKPGQREELIVAAVHRLASQFAVEIESRHHIKTLTEVKADLADDGDDITDDDIAAADAAAAADAEGDWD